MLTEPIVASALTTFPATLRYIQNGDALNTGNHQLQAKDVADAVGHLKGAKANAENAVLTGTASATNLTVTGTITSSGTAVLSGTTNASGTLNLSGTGNVTGPIVRSGASATSVERTFTVDGTADVTIGTSYDLYRLSDPIANRTYTLSNPSANGLSLTVSRIAFGSGNNINIRLADTTLVGVLPGTGASWVKYVSIGGTWTAFAWGGDASSLG